MSYDDRVVPMMRWILLLLAITACAPARGPNDYALSLCGGALSESPPVQTEAERRLMPTGVFAGLLCSYPDIVRPYWEIERWANCRRGVTGADIEWATDHAIVAARRLRKLP